MTTPLSGQPDVLPPVNQAAAPAPAARFSDQSPSDDFQEGPNLIEIASAIHQFLRRWSLRPWSLWDQQLLGEAWPSWQARIVVRLATVLWLFGSQLVFALIIVGVLTGLAILFGH